MFHKLPVVICIDDCFYSSTDEQHQERTTLINFVKDQLEDIAIINGVKPNEVYKNHDLINSSTLIVIDYKFDAPNDDFENAPHVGNELVSAVRQMARDRPIFLLSVMISEEHEDTGDDVFERYVSQRQFGDSSFLRNEIADILSLDRIVERNDKNILIEEFGCPDEQKSELIDSLPDQLNWNLKGDHDDNIDPKKNGIGGVITLYRWIISEFIKYPGILYSDEFCAMTLGIEKSYFIRHIENQLDRCRYRGIFSSTLPRRWWKSKLQDWLIEKDTKYELSGLNDHRTIVKILDIPYENYSKCYVCGEVFPEALGFERDGSPKEYHPVHIKCSQPVHTNKITPYFSMPRLISDSE